MKETGSQRQERNKKIVERFVLTCQSSLVDEMLKKEIFSLDEVSNLYSKECEQCEKEEEYHEDEEQDHEFEARMNEVLEWWLCDEWFLEKLEEMGEPILTNDYGKWWGRTCSGQAILLDSIITEFRKKHATWANKEGD